MNDQLLKAVAAMAAEQVDGDATIDAIIDKMAGLEGAKPDEDETIEVAERLSSKPVDTKLTVRRMTLARLELDQARQLIDESRNAIQARVQSQVHPDCQACSLKRVNVAVDQSSWDDNYVVTGVARCAAPRCVKTDPPQLHHVKRRGKAAGQVVKPAAPSKPAQPAGWGDW